MLRLFWKGLHVFEIPFNLKLPMKTLYRNNVKSISSIPKTASKTLFIVLKMNASILLPPFFTTTVKVFLEEQPLIKMDFFKLLLEHIKVASSDDCFTFT